MKKLLTRGLLTLMFCVAPLASFAQIMNYWFDVSFLALAAEGKAETKNAPLLYGIYPNEMKTYAVVAKLVRAQEEFYNKRELADQQSLKEFDESIANTREAIKQFANMPEVKKEMEATLKLLLEQREQAKKELSAMKIEFTDDPKELLEEAIKHSLGGRLYSAHVDLGNGLYMLATGPKYHNAAEMDYLTFHGEMPEGSRYTWGVVNEEGETVVPFEYEYRGHSSKTDNIYVTRKDKSGTHAGILNYKGEEKFPFKFKEWESIEYPYNDAIFRDSNNLLGIMDFDGTIYFNGQFDFLERDGLGNPYYKVGYKGKRGRVYYENHELKW